MGISLDNGESYTRPEILTFSNAHSTPTQAIWTGQSYLTWWDDGWVQDTVVVRFTFTLTGWATWADPGPTGVTGHSGTIAVITGDYAVNILAEGRFPLGSSGHWRPIAVGFDTQPGTSTGTSFSTGFWYELLPVPGDLDGDYDVDLDDHVRFLDCLEGPDEAQPGGDCTAANFDNDTDVDLRDFAEFQNIYPGPG